MTAHVVRIGALAALLVLPACDLFEPDLRPPAALDPTTTLPPGLAVGETVDVGVTVVDADAKPVSGIEVTWTPSDGTALVAASDRTDGQGVATASWDVGTVVGSVSLSMAVGELQYTFRATLEPAALERIVIDPAAHAFESLGDTVTFTTSAEDAFGNPVDVSPLTWSSSAPAVASVMDGVVVAHGNGTTEVTASSGGVSAGATVDVQQVVVSLSMSPTNPVLALGESLALDAVPVDARGQAVDTAFDLVWASTDESVAAVNQSGLVQTLGAGSTEISVTGGSHAGQAAIDVVDGIRPTITGIQPAMLFAGDTAVITGSDFLADSSVTRVRVAGLATTILSATPTELRVRLPEPGVFPCAPRAEREVVVDVNRLTRSWSHPVSGAPRRTLGVGESVALLGEDVGCAELTEPGSYVISVFSAAASARTTTAFQLVGTAAEPTGTTLLADLTDRVRPRIRIDPEPPSFEARPADVAHLELLEENRRLVERLGPPGLAPPPAGTAARTVAAAQVGEVRTFRIPDIDAGNSCLGYISVSARAVHVGEYGVIWEDQDAPLAGSMDERWGEIGAEYDTIMHPLLLENFGDPLVLDDQLDGNQRFFMLFSEAVNNFTRGVSGFVFSGDFYSRSSCASSDTAEIFYGRVPTSSEPGYGQGTVDAWAWGMRSTVIHEVKHVLSFANKFDVNLENPNFEEQGLEEATARLAEEFYGRALQGYGQRDNVGYGASIACEVRVGDNHPECDPIPVIMGKHYGGVYAYLGAPETLSPFGPTTSEDWTFYGSGWQWARWAIDQSASTEADFIKALVREPRLTGPANLAARAGRPLPELLADYTLAVATDDRPGLAPASPAITFPSWDTRDITAGLNTDFPDNYTSAWPLVTRDVPPGDFEATVSTIRGGAASIFEISGTTAPQLLELLDEFGGTAPTVLGLSIVRVQ